MFIIFRSSGRLENAICFFKCEHKSLKSNENKLSKNCLSDKMKEEIQISAAGAISVWRQAQGILMGVFPTVRKSKKSENRLSQNCLP